MLRKLGFNSLHRIMTDVIYLEIPLAVHVVDELQRDAVDGSSCCKRLSRLRNWIFALTPRALVKPHLNDTQFIVLSFYCPEAALIQSRHSSPPQPAACLLSQRNDCQRQNLQPTAEVS